MTEETVPSKDDHINHNAPSDDGQPRIIRGYCYCGTIQFTVDPTVDSGIPAPPLYCHCESCRRSHSAPLYQVVCIDGPSQLKILGDGEDSIVKYRKPNAKNGITRCFCRHCGTKIYNEFAKLSWVPHDRTPVVVFPSTFSPEDQRNLPPHFRPKNMVNADECVLDMTVLRTLLGPDQDSA